jgi:hypothetical protein
MYWKAYLEKRKLVLLPKKRKRVAKQREKEEQEQELERSDELDSATATTQGKNLNTSEMSTRNVFNPEECDRFDNSARKCGC